MFLASAASWPCVSQPTYSSCVEILPSIFFPLYTFISLPAGFTVIRRVEWELRVRFEFIPTLIMFLFIRFISEVTRGERSTVCCSHNPSVAPSAVNAHSSGWKGNPPGLPQSTCVPVVQDACCVSRSGAEQSQGRGLWGCWDRREGSVANQGELSSLVLIFSCLFLHSACRSALQSASTGPWRSAGCLWSHPAKAKLAKLTR